MLNRALLGKDLKSISLPSNAKLTQTGEHQTRKQKAPSSILPRSKFFLLDFFVSM